MPGRVRKYIKKQFRRARTFAKKRYGGGLRGVANLAKDVYKLKRLVNTERKYIDISFGGQPTTTTAVITHLNPIAAGEGPSQRNGRMVRQLTMQLRGMVDIDTASLTIGMFRVIVFNDKEPQRGTPTPTDLLTANFPDALRNWEQQQEKRFNVLYDKMIMVSSTHKSQRFEYFRKISLHSRWNEDAGSGVSNNKLYAMIMSDNTGAAANLNCNALCRLTYVDN